MKNQPPLNDFQRGVLVAASLIVYLHDMPEVAHDVIDQAGLGGADCSNLSEFDKRNLLKVIDARGGKKLGLSGLTSASL